jgi:hypothetical protein
MTPSTNSLAGSPLTEVTPESFSNRHSPLQSAEPSLQNIPITVKNLPGDALEKPLGFQWWRHGGINE